MWVDNCLPTAPNSAIYFSFLFSGVHKGVDPVNLPWLQAGQAKNRWDTVAASKIKSEVHKGRDQAWWWMVWYIVLLVGMGLRPLLDVETGSLLQGTIL